MDLPFPCPKCGQDVCRRAYTMNLALGYADEQVCLNCLSKIHNQTMGSMFDFVYGYVQSRDCFKKEWDRMKTKNECPLPRTCVIQKCFAKTN